MRVANHIDHLIKILRASLKDIDECPVHSNISLELLKQVASTRMAVSESAQLLCSRYFTKEIPYDRVLDEKLQRLFAYLMKLNQKYINSDGYLFLLRLIIRSHGSRALHIIIQESQFDWLALKVQEEEEVFSYYALEG